jgi:hypothetical protein
MAYFQVGKTARDYALDKGYTNFAAEAKVALFA